MLRIFVWWKASSWSNCTNCTCQSSVFFLSKQKLSYLYLTRLFIRNFYQKLNVDFQTPLRNFQYWLKSTKLDKIIFGLFSCTFKDFCSVSGNWTYFVKKFLILDWYEKLRHIINIRFCASLFIWASRSRRIQAIWLVQIPDVYISDVKMWRRPICIGCWLFVVAAVWCGVVFSSVVQPYGNPDRTFHSISPSQKRQDVVKKD